MSIEISMFIRDKDGNPMSKRNFISDKGSEVRTFWDNNRLRKKRKKNKDKGVATAKEAQSVLADLNRDGEKSDN